MGTKDDDHDGRPDDEDNDFKDDDEETCNPASGGGGGVFGGWSLGGDNVVSQNLSNDVIKMKQVREKGKLGESLVDFEHNTTRIESLTGTAKYRVPDGLTSTTLSEVKNYSGTLSYTKQLRDYVLYSQEHNLQMHLYTNAPNLSAPLQELVDAGKIILHVLGKG